ncbi:hypothetical protein COV28_02160 [candidate division WWE3 bacterium CG10_big_fil_rev_8_21_14_0_10_48_23]|uniref:Uncharacterized protein n=1 Tax=candidate division WWE3 bacterium CG_4_9_14_0_2_um_filter_48_10 TaxID=1975078 RepID=A0A2M8EIV8_UNCKA|nr:MAG: hypothetical protein CO059_02035 [candidate division WWE3 bacterium CG_4_9_14_0_2_um_filter_48_10]PJE51643.1 MAG: hypothetical protein COV28_02160 [candidate division WWE3 bacterium CG10_big_fil_rev_8_21_14_0_10_48_23]
MEKEYWVVVAISLFVLSSALESFAGPVQLEIANPFAFLSQNYLSVYPLTAAAIGVRALALLVSALLVVSLIEKQYFLKAAILLAVGMVAEAYAVQQLATGMEFTPIQWTLSLAYAGILLLPAILCYFLMGVLGGLSTRLSGEPEEKEEKEESQKRIDRLKGLNP